MAKCTKGRTDGTKKINFPIECLFVFSGDMRGGQDMVQDNVRLCALHWTLAAGFPPLVGDCCSYTQLCPGPGSRVVAYLTIPHLTYLPNRVVVTLLPPHTVLLLLLLLQDAVDCCGTVIIKHQMVVASVTLAWARATVWRSS